MNPGVAFKLHMDMRLRGGLTFHDRLGAIAERSYLSDCFLQFCLLCGGC